MMSINVTELLVKTLENACKDLVNRAVTECATKYHFDAHEAMAQLGTEKISIHAKKMIRGPVAKDKPSKDDIPMPFMADHVNHDNCQGLRFNHGLFTQCTTKKMNASQFCKTCQMDADKNASGEPTCGTVQKRIAMADNFVDAKGRKPKNYAFLLKKMKIDVEHAIRFAQGKNIDITAFINHQTSEKTKKTKTKSTNETTDNSDTNSVTNSETNSKKRGRPRKQPMQVEAVTDMFALYHEPQPIESQPEPEQEQQPITPETLKLNNDEKDAKKAQLEAKKVQEKAEKEAKKAQEKAEKEAKKAQEKQEKADKKALEKQEKADKKALEKTNKTNTKETNTTDTNNANTADTNNANITQQVTDTILAHNNTKNTNTNTKTKTIKVDGVTYTLHIDNNQVYDQNNNHVGNFDPNEKSIEFFEEQDEEELSDDEFDN